MPSINKECKIERRILLSVLRITSVLLQLNIHTFTNCIVLLPIVLLYYLPIVLFITCNYF